MFIRRLQTSCIPHLVYSVPLPGVSSAIPFEAPGAKPCGFRGSNAILKIVEYRQTMDTADSSLPELSRNPLMQAMRRVIQAAAKSHLAPECLSRMSPDLAAIGRIMDLTPGQSLLFTLFVEMSYAQEINLRDLCEYVECQYIDLAAMAEELEVLLERQLIRKREAAPPATGSPVRFSTPSNKGRVLHPLR